MPLRVVVCGNVGAGKSTAIQLASCALRQHDGLKVDEHLEQLSRWTPMLSSMFESSPPTSSAGTLLFQTFGPLLDKVQETSSIRASTSDIAICERDIATTSSVFTRASLRDDYAPSTITEAHAHLFRELVEAVDDATGGTLTRTPDLLLYLRVPPALCLERIKRRNRDVETSVMAKRDLEVLHEEHERFFDEHCGNKVVLDVTEADTAPTVALRIAESIRGYTILPSQTRLIIDH